MIHGLRVDAPGFSFLCGPDPTAFGVWMSAEALYNAVFFGAPGIYVALGHCSEASLQVGLRGEARRLADALHGLESWFTELRKAGEEESAHGAVTQAQASAITSALDSEAGRLKQETERLTCETEQLRQETVRLRRDTASLRRGQ